MTKIALPEFTVDTTGGAMIAVHWSDDVARYHMWLDHKTNFTTGQGVVYKNPPLGVERGSPADFSTRRLDATSKTWAPVVAAMLEKINAEQMVAKAIEARDQRELREKVDAQAKRAETIRNGLRTLAAETAVAGPHGGVWEHIEHLARKAPDLTLIRMAHLIQGLG